MGAGARSGAAAGALVCRLSHPRAYRLLAAPEKNRRAVRSGPDGGEQSQLWHDCLLALLSHFLSEESLEQYANRRTARRAAVARSPAARFARRARLRFRQTDSGAFQRFSGRAAE